MRAVAVTVTYACVAALWIYASDALLALIFTDASLVAIVSTYKGLAFVAVTSALLYVTLRAAGRSRSEPAAELGFRLWPPLLIFGAFVAVVWATGYFVYRGIEQTVTRNAEEMLGAVADLKAHQVAEWLSQRKSHAERTVRSPFVAPLAELWLDGAEGDEKTARLLRSRISGLVAREPWSGARLVDLQGVVRLAVGNDRPLSREAAVLVQQAAESRRVLFRDVHLNEVGIPTIAFFTPLVVSQGARERSVAVLVMEIAAAPHLFRLVARWPLTSRTGEAFLVRREGSSAVVLTDLRHRSGSSLAVRLPAVSSEVVAQSLQHPRTAVSGLDYRGVPVLASTRQIRGAPWVLIAKVDRSEIRGPVAESARLVALFVAVLVIVAGLAVTFWLRQQRATALMRHYRAAERIAFLSSHDTLTGLPNRSVMHDFVQQSLAMARRNDSALALLSVDIDRFKTINDSLGHPVGDALLKQIARRLRCVVRDQDIVARLGDDEFLILLPGLRRAGHAAAHVARKVLAEIREPVAVDAHVLRVTGSVGISVFPQDGADVTSLMKNADAAMYHAKERGRNNYQFFTSDMNVRAVEALAMEMSLRTAVQRGDFTLHYQPQVDAASGQIISAEALIRWSHPELGPISPADFIPIAEEHGLIVPIGEWVIRTVCVQVRHWQDTGVPVVPIAVNLSAVHFRQGELVGHIRSILEESGIEARFLRLELTESILMHDADQAIAVLLELSEMGVSVAIDDFGTGYSSLSYLRRFPIDRLKIDQSFVAEVTTSSDAAAIAVAIIGMGRTMKLRVVAEGVETAEQLAFLTAEGCDELQGFHIARPMDASQLAGLLTRSIPLVTLPLTGS